MRGSTPYELRGTALVLSRGTLENPALRFGRERTGLYRLDDGVVAFGVKQLKVLELLSPSVTEPGRSSVNLYSHAPGDGQVTPLTLVRSNATIQNNQETRLDFQEVAIPVARFASYLQGTSPLRYGFKWYGFSAGLHATPAMTLDADKNLTVFGSTIWARPATGAASLSASSAQVDQNAGVLLSANANAQTLALSLQGGTSPTGGLGTARGDVSLFTVHAGALVLGTTSVARLRFEAAGNATWKLAAGAANHIDFIRSTDTTVVFSVTDTGGVGLQPGSVGNAQLATNAVTAPKILDGEVGTTKLANLAVIDTKLGDLAVTTPKLAALSVTTAKIANGAVGTTQLADGNVTAGKLADGNVTAGKLAAGVAVANLGYTPVNILNPNYASTGASYAGGSGFFDCGPGPENPNPAAGYLVIQSRHYNWAAGTNYLLQIASQHAYVPETYIRQSWGSAGTWYKLWHSGNHGYTSGLIAQDSARVGNRTPTATSTANAIPIADGAGKLDSWISPSVVSGVVPLNGVIMFRSAAELAAAGASWAQDDTWAGRMPIGVGTTFGQTWADGSLYGSSWTPFPGSSGVSGPPDGVTSYQGGPTSAAGATHGHPITIPAYTWLPPSRGTLFGRRVS